MCIIWEQLRYARVWHKLPLWYENNHDILESNTNRPCTKHVVGKDFHYIQALWCDRPVLYSLKKYLKLKCLLMSYFPVVQSFDILHIERQSCCSALYKTPEAEKGALAERHVPIFEFRYLRNNFGYTDHKNSTKHVVVCVRIFCIQVPSKYLDCCYTPQNILTV